MTQPAWALDRAPRTPAGTPDALDEVSTKRGGRIRCPKCFWQPRKSDRWFCSKCNQGRWNTFETGGLCPVCSYRWTWTTCLACTEWSLHEEWYEKRA